MADEAGPGVYDVITPRDYTRDGETKTKWTRIGVAFPTGSNRELNIQLDALPMNGKICVRERQERDSGGRPPQNPAPKDPGSDDIPF
jgi:hypothetical protein